MKTLTTTAAPNNGCLFCLLFFVSFRYLFWGEWEGAPEFLIISSGRFLHLSMCHCLATSFFLFACFPFCLDLSGRVTLKWTVGRSWRNGCVGKLAEQTHHPISKSGAFLCVCVSLAFFFSFPLRSIQLSIFVPVFPPWARWTVVEKLERFFPLFFCITLLVYRGGRGKRIAAEAPAPVELMPS